MRTRFRSNGTPWLVAGALVAAALRAGAQESGCEPEFDSTFELIEKVIFENRGCTSSGCHDQSAQGGLVLLPGVAYDNLIDQPVQSVPTEQFPGLRRVVPARKDRSLLWLNVAAATMPDLWKAPKQPMPLGFAPLARNELDLLSMWFDYGAPREGVVPGTGELVDTCLPKPEPLKVEPLAPPPPGEGLQIRAPVQLLKARSEREVCFATYYDFTGQVPEESLGPGGTTMLLKNIEGRQDPFSHHAVALVYLGTTPIDSPVWGPFACVGGERAGDACDPMDSTACGSGVCASPPVPSVACIGYGPGDAGILNGGAIFSTMASGIRGIDGVYAAAPIKGILVWNSHAFNVNDEDAEFRMWMNLEFAKKEEQIHPLFGIIDTSRIGDAGAPAFGTNIVCQRYVLPENVSLLELSSHVHKRGKRFRIFRGEFICAGGANYGATCSPLPPDPDFPVPDLCQGAPCLARRVPEGGDCNGDVRVSIDEVVTAVNIALGYVPIHQCLRIDRDRNVAVSIDELLTAVEAMMNPGSLDPEEALLYTSLTYADPFVLSLDPPLEIPGPSPPEERTLTYCAEYDNGFTDPSTVKRASMVPDNGAACNPTHCVEGRVGEPCGGSFPAQRDQSCDDPPGSGNGFCDACAVRFGVSTDDEMIVLTGSFIER